MLNTFSTTFLSELYKEKKLSVHNNSKCFECLERFDNYVSGKVIDKNISIEYNKFIPREIYDFILDAPQTVYEYTFLNVTLYFIDYMNTPKEVYDEYAKRLSMAIRFIGDKHNKCNKLSLSIKVFMTPFTRTLNETHDIISHTNVNGGSTYSCIDDNIITVYRKEEWLKVCIHEYMHSIGADAKIRTNLSDLFYTNSVILVGEAYVEYWAVILNCMICAYFTCGGNDKLFSLLFEKYVRAERIFSFIQANKLFHHQNIFYQDLFSPNDWRENTNVFSYYILKLLFLYDYKEFTKRCQLNNKNTYVVDNDLFIANFTKCFYKNKHFLHYMKLFSDVSFMDNSLRMSIIELN
jgi:hypothetical protein